MRLQLPVRPESGDVVEFGYEQHNTGFRVIAEEVGVFHGFTEKVKSSGRKEVCNQRKEDFESARAKFKRVTADGCMTLHLITTRRD